ncbi:MAG: response regulator [Candidatus Marinimicrobia bacterium]|jgi:DNA-binding response OmpR family regulator|nr:response regulator [Candidatus Neomarinimicrobiota bacterium]
MSRLLFIDDDVDFLKIMTLYFEKNDYIVDTAITPEAGLKKIKNQTPDLVVLDVMMPLEFEGFELARKIREELRLTVLPIIILSCIHDRKEIPYRFAPDRDYLPVDVFLDKPVNPKNLLEKVENLLGQRREIPNSDL